MTTKIVEHSTVYHQSYGRGTVTVRTQRYATVEFDSGYRKNVRAEELTTEPTEVPAVDQEYKETTPYQDVEDARRAEAHAWLTEVPAVDPTIRAEAGARSTRLALGLPEPTEVPATLHTRTETSMGRGTVVARSEQGPDHWVVALDNGTAVVVAGSDVRANRTAEFPPAPETDAYQDAATDAHFETLTPEQAEAERERLILTGSADPLVGRGPAEDAPRYAWTAEGEVTSGTLDRYRHDYEVAYYSDLTMGYEVWDGTSVHPVHVHHQGNTDDYMYYTLYVRENGATGRIVDWTYMTIDGRA